MTHVSFTSVYSRLVPITSDCFFAQKISPATQEIQGLQGLKLL